MGESFGHLPPNLWVQLWAFPLVPFPLFPTPLPHLQSLREINTHTKHSSPAGPLSHLINYFPPPGRALGLGAEGPVFTQAPERPRWAKLGKPYSSVPSLPSWDRALLSPALHPTQGIFRSWSGVESKGLGDLLTAPGLHSHLLGAWGKGEAASSLSTLPVSDLRPTAWI